MPSGPMWVTKAKKGARRSTRPGYLLAGGDPGDRQPLTHRASPREGRSRGRPRPDGSTAGARPSGTAAGPRQRREGAISGGDAGHLGPGAAAHRPAGQAGDPPPAPAGLAVSAGDQDPLWRPDGAREDESDLRRSGGGPGAPRGTHGLRGTDAVDQPADERPAGP